MKRNQLKGVQKDKLEINEWRGTRPVQDFAGRSLPAAAGERDCERVEGPARVGVDAVLPAVDLAGEPRGVLPEVSALATERGRSGRTGDAGAGDADAPAIGSENGAIGTATTG